MDIRKRARLLSLVGDLTDRDSPDAYVTLESFFDGNDDRGSIWVNLSKPDHVSEISDLLRAIRSRQVVGDLRVLVTKFDGGDEWPFSDTIVVVTTAGIEEVRSWFGAEFAPDGISLLPSIPYPDRRLLVGMNCWALWWD